MSLPFVTEKTLELFKKEFFASNSKKFAPEILTKMNEDNPLLCETLCKCGMKLSQEVAAGAAYGAAMIYRLLELQQQADEATEMVARN